MTSIPFGLGVGVKSLHYASWSVMHEKHSHAYSALVLHAGRAEKWQFLMMQQAWTPSKHRLFCTSKNTCGKGSKGIPDLGPATNLQQQRQLERARACVAPSMFKSLAKIAQRSPDKGPCSLLQRAKTTPGAIASPPWGKKSLAPLSCKAEEAIFMVHEQQAVT